MVTKYILTPIYGGSTNYRTEKLVNIMHGQS